MKLYWINTWTSNPHLEEGEVLKETPKTYVYLNRSQMTVNKAEMPSKGIYLSAIDAWTAFSESSEQEIEYLQKSIHNAEQRRAYAAAQIEAWKEEEACDAGRT